MKFFEFLSKIDWGYLLPALILVGCNLFGVSALISTQSGWFFAKTPDDTEIVIGTLASKHIQMPPLFKTAGICAMVFCALAVVFAITGCTLGFVMAFGPSSRRRFAIGTCCWISTGIAAILFVICWTEFLAVVYGKWEDLVASSLIADPHADWALVFVANASSLCLMCCGLFLWALVGRPDPVEVHGNSKFASDYGQLFHDPSDEEEFSN